MKDIDVMFEYLVLESIDDDFCCKACVIKIAALIKEYDELNDF